MPFAGCYKHRLMPLPFTRRIELTRRAVRHIHLIVACMFAFTGVANGAVLNICWVGGAGYTMTGRMELPDKAMRKSIVTEADVTAFQITGYLDGAKVGSWNLKQRSPNTTWLLRFEPETLSFPVGGSFGSLVSQGWNANGDVNDCGNPGFGFNSGNWAQDVCINGVYIRESSIDPFTPLVATYDPVTPDCRATPALSKRRNKD